MRTSKAMTQLKEIATTAPVDSPDPIAAPRGGSQGRGRSRPWERQASLLPIDPGASACSGRDPWPNDGDGCAHPKCIGRGGGERLGLEVALKPRLQASPRCFLP
ncbi:5-oxoprolinase [Platysternon megacephalum]|uniref:5-oxoprolinase n=1 Tax=Platysternon megacephalum TaxID=55544 RepID=A0A4D9DSF0_9SAUR|nr:5-oxoprolinase [Platysternon megacephalum]